MIHEDRSFRRSEYETMCHHFPGVRVIKRADADATILPMLDAAGFKLSAMERRRNVTTLELFHLQYFAQGKRVLLMDTDILFFQRPDELLRAMASPENEWVTVQ